MKNKLSLFLFLFTIAMPVNADDGAGWGYHNDSQEDTSVGYDELENDPQDQNDFDLPAHLHLRRDMPDEHSQEENAQDTAPYLSSEEEFLKGQREYQDLSEAPDQDDVSENSVMPEEEESSDRIFMQSASPEDADINLAPPLAGERPLVWSSAPGGNEEGNAPILSSENQEKPEENLENIPAGRATYKGMIAKEGMIPKGIIGYNNSRRYYNR